MHILILALALMAPPDTQEFERLQVWADGAPARAKAEQIRELELRRAETHDAIRRLIQHLRKLDAALDGPISDHKDIKKYRSLERRAAKAIGAE